MSRTKSKPEFVRENRDGSYVYVKRLTFGGEVHKHGNEFYAHDRQGRYLGWTSDQEEAEFMATQGKMNDTAIDDGSDLALWLAWNDAVDGGATVLGNQAGMQAIRFGSVYLIACSDENGYEVEFLADNEFFERYGDDSWHSCLDLFIVDREKILRLE